MEQFIVKKAGLIIDPLSTAPNIVTDYSSALDGEKVVLGERDIITLIVVVAQDDYIFKVDTF